MAERELTTSEAAAAAGISVELLRKYKARGFLKLAPPGVAGQGRGVQSMWSVAAVQELKEFVSVPRNSGSRHKKKASTLPSHKDAGHE